MANIDQIDVNDGVAERYCLQNFDAENSTMESRKHLKFWAAVVI